MTEHLIDDKINNATKEALSKTESRMNQDMQKKTKDLKKFMNEEFKKSQIAISGMQYDINATNSNMLK